MEKSLKRWLGKVNPYIWWSAGFCCSLGLVQGLSSWRPQVSWIVHGNLSNQHRDVTTWIVWGKVMRDALASEGPLQLPPQTGWGIESEDDQVRLFLYLMKCWVLLSLRPWSSHHLEHSPTPHRLPVLPQHDPAVLPQHDPGVPLQAMEQSTRLPAPPYMVPGDPSQALEQLLTSCRLPVLPFLVSGDPSQALEQSTISYRLPVLPYMVPGKWTVRFRSPGIDMS